ncbi:hypothetical protein LCGC14_1309930 [marine sediment metagenome]|uniref:ribonucleoside-diphosphate reductase n=1 Tax=marine sediment metagenome TaxID=412755 RepID=A0A0F9NQ54_9ZZZZ
MPEIVYGDDIIDEWPTVRKGLGHTVRITDTRGNIYKMYINTGCYKDGRLGEVFIRMGKEGSTVRGLLNTVGILMTTLLRNGVPVNQVCGLLREGGHSYPPSGSTDNDDLPTADSLIGYLADWLEENFG